MSVQIQCTFTNEEYQALEGIASRNHTQVHNLLEQLTRTALTRQQRSPLEQLTHEVQEAKRAGYQAPRRNRGGRTA